MITVKVSVTEKHIAEGECLDANFCAFALALYDALPAAGIRTDYVRVGISGATDDGDAYAGWQARVREPNHRWLVAPLSREIVDWIRAFDQEKPVQPFDVELTWDEEVAS